MPDQHAFLGPSSAKRWLTCTRSAHFARDVPNEASAAAEEGTLAHEVAELAVRERFGLPLIDLCNPDKAELYDNDMYRNANAFADWVSDQIGVSPDVVETEIQLQIPFVPESFGTCDLMILTTDPVFEYNVLWIFDYKYGRGVEVETEGNYQLRIYAAAAYERFKDQFDIQQVAYGIFQPRTDNMGIEKTTPEQLAQWVDEYVRPRAQLAYLGEGEFCPGPWCKSSFCPARGKCKHYQEYLFKIPITDDHDALSDDDLNAILERSELIQDYINSVKTHIRARLLDGITLPGWKLVKGVTRRKWGSKQEIALKKLEEALGHEAVYEEQPKSLATLEKALGRKEFDALVGEYVVKPEGPINLAREDSKGEEYVPALGVMDLF